MDTNPCAELFDSIPAPPVGHIAAEEGVWMDITKFPVPEGYAWMDMGALVDPTEHPELAEVLTAVTGKAQVPDFRGAVIVQGVRQPPGRVAVLIKTRST